MIVKISVVWEWWRYCLNYDSHNGGMMIVRRVIVEGLLVIIVTLGDDYS